MTTSAAKALKRRYPGCLVVAAVEEKSESIVRMNPYVDEVFLFKVTTFRDRMKLLITHPRSAREFRRGLEEALSRIRAYSFSTAVDMQGRFRTGLLAYLSGAARRIGYENWGELNSLFINQTVAAQTFRRPGEEALFLLKPLGIPQEDPTLCLMADPETARKTDLLLERFQLNPKRAVGLCPATTHPAKHWTEEGWARAADFLAEERNLQPVFLGGPRDIELIRRINALTKTPAPSFAGITSLEESAALVGRLRMALSVDTGLAHISVAMGTPVVILHGSTPFERMQGEPKVAVVAPPDSCAMRLKNSKIRPGCDCTSRIDPMNVFRAMDALLQRTERPNADAAVWAAETQK
jgi:heptosyltransferase-1